MAAGDGVGERAPSASGTLTVPVLNSQLTGGSGVEVAAGGRVTPAVGATRASPSHQRRPDRRARARWWVQPVESVLAPLPSGTWAALGPQAVVITVIAMATAPLHTLSRVVAWRSSLIRIQATLYTTRVRPPHVSPD